MSVGSEIAIFVIFAISLHFLMAVGGLLIGLAAALTTVFYPAASEAVIYAILMGVLLLRPRGLVGEEGMMS